MIKLKFTKKRRLNKKIRAYFLLQLATLLEAGIPLITALNQTDHFTNHPELKKSIIQIIKQLEQGLSLHEALNTTQQFSSMTIHIIKVGEITGRLYEFIHLASNLIEKQLHLKERLINLAIYPSILFITMISITTLLMLFVIPELQLLFGSTNKLPLITRAVIFLSHIFPYTISFLAFALFLLIFLTKIQLKRSPLFKYRVDTYLAKKVWLRMKFTALFSQTLGNCYSAGIPLEESLEISLSLTNNRFIKSQIQLCILMIQSGHSLAESLRKSALFSEITLQMVALGEEAGKLNLLLLKTAKLEEEKLNNLIEKLTLLLEPILMLIMGGVIGGLVIAIYWPLFQIGNVIA